MADEDLKPWEKYGKKPAPAAGPWLKYAKPVEAAPAQAPAAPTGMSLEQLAYQKARAAGQMPAPVGGGADRAAQADAMAEFEQYNPGKIAQYGYKTPADLPKRGESFPPVGVGGRSGMGPGGIVQGPGMSSNQGMLYGLANAATFGLGQEINAGIEAALTEKTFGEALKGYEDVQQDAMGSGTYGAGNMLGALLPGGMGAKFIQGAKSLPGTIGRGILAGAGTGAVMGAGEPVEDRLRSAAGGAVLGGGLGALAPVLGGVLGAASRAIGDRVATGGGIRAAAEKLGVSDKATRELVRRMGAELPDDLAAGMSRAGPGAMLADAGPGMSSFLDAMVTGAGPGARLPLGRLAERAGIEGKTLGKVMDDTLGPAPVGPTKANAEIRAAGREGTNKAYEEALSQPIDYASDAGIRLEGLIDRIPASAVASANKLIKARGKGQAQIKATIADDGTVKFETLPNAYQWNEIKKALDDMSGAAGRAGSRGEAGAWGGLAKEVRDTLSEVSPGYKEALGMAAEGLRKEDALDLGYRLLAPGTKREEVFDFAANATGGELKEVQKGLRGQIDEILANVKASATNPDIDAKQAQAALASLTSKAAQAKMEAIMGDAWPKLKEQIERVSAASGLKARVGGNSATAGRQIENETVNAGVDPGPLRRGEPVKAVKEWAATLMGSSDRAIKGVRQEVKAEIADLLTRYGQGPEIMKLIEEMVIRSMRDPKSGKALAKAVETGLLGQIAPGTQAIAPLTQGRQ